MKTFRLASLMLTAALALGGANVFGMQPPGEGPRPNRDAGPPDGPRLDDRGRPEGAPPSRPGEGFGGDYGPPPRGPGMNPGGGPPGPGGPYRPDGRPGPDGPPPLTPLEARDEKLRSLLDEEAQLRRDCEQAAEEARGDQAKVEELRAIVTRHFDIRHEIRARKVELLEQELAALKESLVQRQERKELLVDDRVSELLGKPSPIDF